MALADANRSIDAAGGFVPPIRRRFPVGAALDPAADDDGRCTDGEKMIEKVVRSHTRFNVNMARIGGLMRLAMSGEGQFKSTGFMQYEGGQYDRAIQDYDEAIRFNPQLFNSFVGRALSHSAKGDYHRPIADYNEAI